jgi:chromosome segregation ATPase
MRGACSALLAAVLIQGCATPVPSSQSEQIADRVAALHDAVIVYVPDTRRKQRLHPAIDNFDDEFRTFRAATVAYHDLLRALNAQPAASRGQFADLTARYEAEGEAHRERVTQIHYNLIALTTADEWRSLARHEAALLELELPARDSGASAHVTLTGHAVAELQQKARAMAAQPQRRQAIDAAFKRWEAHATRIDQARDDNRRAFFALLAKHDVVSAEFERLYAEADAIGAQAVDVALDLRFGVREQLSEEDWRQLFAPAREPEPDDAPTKA